MVGDSVMGPSLKMALSWRTYLAPAKKFRCSSQCSGLNKGCIAILQIRGTEGYATSTEQFVEVTIAIAFLGSPPIYP